MPSTAELSKQVADLNGQLKALITASAEGDANLLKQINLLKGEVSALSTELERQAALAGMRYAQLDELEDYIKNPTPTPDPDPPPDPEPEEPETVIDYLDFLDQKAGDMFTASLVGRGRDLQRYVITASTKASQVPTTGVNIFQGQRAGVLTKAEELNSILLQGYTVDLSDVLHNCNGLQVAYVKNPTVENIGVRGCRGSSSSPPGETASLSLWHCGEGGGVCTLEDILLDGATRDDVLVAASLLMLNDSYNFTVDGLVATGALYGFGAAIWQCGGVNVFNQPDFRGCRKAINHEQPRSGASFTYNQPDCRDQLGAGGGRPHVVFNGNFIHTSTTYPQLWIDQPLWDDTLTAFRVGVITNGTYYLGKPQTCRPQDVHVRLEPGGPWYVGPISNSELVIGQAW